MSLIRFASLTSLALSFSLVGCASDESENTEPVTAAESAVAHGAVEGMVRVMSPVANVNLVAIAASYQSSFLQGGLSCAATALQGTTVLEVTFDCDGLLATTGSLRLEQTSATSFEATADLTIGEVVIDGSLALSAPATGPRTLDVSLDIEGGQRSLSIAADASWVPAGPCVTYSASGDIAASGPNGSGAASIDVNSKLLCF